MKGLANESVDAFDTHFHLYDEDDLSGLVARAHAAGVHRLLVAGAPLGRMPRLLDRIRPHTCVRAAAGVHPHEAEAFDGDPAPYREWLARPDVVAVGEIGLDNHYRHATTTAQTRVFAAFLQLAAATELPAIVHCREAFEETYRIIDRELPPEHPFVIHCFTGTAEWAERFVARGAYISFSGILTFPRTPEVRKALHTVPRARLLFETDAPFLAPVPKRGQRNEPANVRHVLACAATELGIDIDQLAAETTANAMRLFAWPPADAEA